MPMSSPQMTRMFGLLSGIYLIPSLGTRGSFVHRLVNAEAGRVDAAAGTL